MKSVGQIRRAILALFCVFALLQTAHAQEVMPELLPFAWSQVRTTLPNSIKVFAGESYRYDGLPVRVWRVEIDYFDINLTARPFLSKSPTGKESVSAMATQNGALLAVNGGYFDMTSRPARTYSLVKSGGQILAQNIGKVNRANGPYFVLRGAFGVRPDRSFALDWIGHFGADVLSFASPLPNLPQAIAPAPVATTGANWNDVPDAIGGGPILLKNGQARLTYDEEAFFGSGYEANKPYPRTAVGFTADHRLLLFIIDGKQPNWSVGLTLAQLATQMQEFGCTDAMNLDGGGSTTLAVQGSVLNRPSDGRERAVTSILAIVPTGF